MLFLLVLVLACVGVQAQEPQKSSPSETPGKVDPEARKRIELNLLGATDTAAGESRRNENIQFNLVDNNALKELNVRLGITATLVNEFRPDRSYFGAEYGNTPAAPIHMAIPLRPASGLHGSAHWSHLNSVTSARTFFQVGGVKPAHENDYGFVASFRTGMGGWLQLEGRGTNIRGNVNGNVLVPQLVERVPLTADPALRALLSRWLAAYPAEPPNRTDINPRALNTNAPQTIDNRIGGIRLDQYVNTRDRLTLQYNYTSQHVDAFQLVAGQNPDTDTRNHRARLTWTRAWSAATTLDASAAFERTGSLLVPESNAVGPMVSIGGLETLGPLAIIPIDRAQNLFRYAAQAQHLTGRHTYRAGFGFTRRQLNGRETDAHRGVFSFGNDFGRDAITNFRLGIPTQYLVSIGDIHRGFRNNDWQFYIGDVWKASPAFTLSYGLRWQPITRPYEVHGRNPIAYDSDANNVAPQLGLAWRLPNSWGLLRAAAGVQFGEIYPVTFQQVRFSPPGSVKIVVPTPDLLNPLGALSADPKGNLYLLDPQLATPYEYQYNLSWEPEWRSAWRMQLGYVGSRQHKLLTMWYLNRSHIVEGIPQTTATLNQRRPDPNYAEKRLVVNGSRGYFDALRATLLGPQWRGLSLDASYWFSKAMDLGSSYTNTAYDADSRLSRSQSEYETHGDLKALSSFDQPHAFLLRSAYRLPVAATGQGWLGRLAASWDVSAVVLLKKGTPFTVGSGSDGPGYGNVDGNGGDRPMLLDAALLGRTIGDPDTSRALLPRSAFRYMNPLDLRGNLGRNTFRKGGIRNVNAALARTFTLRREQRLTVRAESVNLLNTPQFAEPGLDLANGNFAQITNTLNEGRTFRLALQLGW